jgi:hypothetical protein
LGLSIGFRWIPANTAESGTEWAGPTKASL